MRILIADDESIIRMGLTAMLQELGHEVLAAANGREALQMARRHDPDLAILDIEMPFTSGLQAAATLARTNPLPILILTAYSEESLIEEASDLPIHGYLVKPVESSHLAAAIAVARKRFAERESLTRTAGDLAASLATRKVVDRAKGRLMARGMSEEEAYRLLQRRAREQRQSMRQAAEEVLAEEERGSN